MSSFFVWLIECWIGDFYLSLILENILPFFRNKDLQFTIGGDVSRDDETSVCVTKNGQRSHPVLAFQASMVKKESCYQIYFRSSHFCSADSLWVVQLTCCLVDQLNSQIVHVHRICISEIICHCHHQLNSYSIVLILWHITDGIKCSAIIPKAQNPMPSLILDTDG